MRMKEFLTLVVLVFVSMTACAAGQDEVVRSKDGRMTFVPRRTSSFTGSAPSDQGLVTIFDNIGRAYPKGSYSCCDAFTVAGPAQSGPEAWQAAAFKPAANHTVTRIEVAVGLNAGTADVVLSLNHDHNGLPGAAIKTWHLTNLPLAGQCCTVEVKEDAAGIPITAGTQYWLVVSTRKGSDFQGGWNANDTNQVNSMKTAYYCSGPAGVCQNNNQWTIEKSLPGPAFALLGSK
jgi:hypothetical protein